MDYVRFGNTGLRVSRICLGCMSYGDSALGSHSWAMDEAAAQPFYRKAFELGINFFDTANAYSQGTSEEILGRAIRAHGRRDRMVIATKLFFPLDRYDPNSRGLSRKSIFRELDASLKRLGMDYVDLYQIHRWDYETPLEETLEALHDVVKSGRVRYLGASSMFAWQFARALYLADRHGWTRFASMQPQYNLLYREEEREMLPLCQWEQIAVIPWSPLARGRLSRPWKSEPTTREQTDKFANTLFAASEAADRHVVNRVTEVAAARELSQSQIALAWMLSKPVITAPIVGATRLIHLEDAVAALSVKLSEEEIRKLEEPYVPHPIVGFA
jgi:aryl-alcohol dehydrogenase-like predicted oxidoreductase